MSYKNTVPVNHETRAAFLSALLLPFEPTDDDCWFWGGNKSNNGYGFIYVKGFKLENAHRFSFRLFKGEIGNGLCVLHSCDNKLCVNPRHLTVGTQQENIIDCITKNRFTQAYKNGEQNPSCKLLDNQVKEIFILKESGLTQQEIARKFKVNRSTIGKILRKERRTSAL